MYKACFSLLTTEQSWTSRMSYYKHIKMKFICVIILFLTYYKSCESTGKYLTPNVLLLQVTENMSVNINLYCGDHNDEDINWKLNGFPLKNHGNQIHITVRYLEGGNYSCHNKAGDVLNHTLVLQEGVGYRKSILRLQDDSSEYISCIAKNFDGKFQCTWNNTHNRRDAELLHFNVARVSGDSGNINCSLDGNTLHCEDGKHCPFGEEPCQLGLSFYFRSKNRCEEYQRRFFIFDIVKPDKVTINKVGHRKFEWVRPETWSNPGSYFQLLYEVRVFERNGTCDQKETCSHITTSNDEEFTVPTRRKKYKLCVRVKEEASDSIWSDWSTHREPHPQ
ncbi:interleukin-12 subunit beta [Sardina pilchardus]|uniref:interleukin-12 subunit beta n=1 Tax=Sardina pilchardus TaxID=27697 RepID=UPI002E0FE1B1